MSCRAGPPTRARRVLALARVCVLAYAVRCAGAPSPLRGSAGAHRASSCSASTASIPEMLRETMQRYPERMPNFASSSTKGGLHALGTSTPPQSPVAWSNFITGLDPGGHGIFDFLHRDPLTRAPIPSTTSRRGARRAVRRLAVPARRRARARPTAAARPSGAARATRRARGHLAHAGELPGRAGAGPVVLRDDDAGDRLGVRRVHASTRPSRSDGAFTIGKKIVPVPIVRRPHRDARSPARRTCSSEEPSAGLRSPLTINIDRAPAPRPSRSTATSWCSSRANGASSSPVGVRRCCPPAW